MNVHALLSHAIPEDAGDAEVAEMVREAMRETKLPEETIEAFSQSDLLKMHGIGGYTTALFIRNAQRAGLEKCGLTPALVDLLVSAIERQRGEYDSRISVSQRELYPSEIMIFVSTGLAYTFGASPLTSYAVPCLIMHLTFNLPEDPLLMLS